MSLADFLLGRSLELVERGLVPDGVVRAGIRRLCEARRREVRTAHGGRAMRAFLESMSEGPVALLPEKANEQHYELPPAFFEHVLGRHRKYSCGYWPDGVRTLDEAETGALVETCEHAALADDQDILELGCGWGSLTLWMAERYPRSRITAVSNSAPQRAFIESTARNHGLANVRVITADMNEFQPDGVFDRVVSVEMFEHMRNYRELLRRVASWLRPEGLAFVHVFCHRTGAYPFETGGADNWMGRHFFTGGLMPSRDLFERFDDHLHVTASWWWSGEHYQRTAEAWLSNLDARRGEVTPILEATYGRGEAERWRRRWRVFFMACAELFGFGGGEEWGVTHVRLERVVGVDADGGVGMGADASTGAGGSTGAHAVAHTDADAHTVAPALTHSLAYPSSSPRRRGSS